MFTLEPAKWVCLFFKSPLFVASLRFLPLLEGISWFKRNTARQTTDLGCSLKNISRLFVCSGAASSEVVLLLSASKMDASELAKASFQRGDWIGGLVLYCYWVGSVDFSFLDSPHIILLTSKKFHFLLGHLQHPRVHGLDSLFGKTRLLAHNKVRLLAHQFWIGVFFGRGFPCNFQTAKWKESDSPIWLWLKKPVPKWNPGKWKHGLQHLRFAPPIVLF